MGNSLKRIEKSTTRGIYSTRVGCNVVGHLCEKDELRQKLGHNKTTREHFPLLFLSFIARLTFACDWIEMEWNFCCYPKVKQSKERIKLIVLVKLSSQLSM